jgi:hypothetical protein
MDLSLEDNAWWKHPASRVNTLYRGNLFMVPWLDKEGLTKYLSSYNYLSSSY